MEHCSIEGKNILIVEDIVDSGLSMEKLIETLTVLSNLIILIHFIMF